MRAFVVSADGGVYSLEVVAVCSTIERAKAMGDAFVVSRQQVIIDEWIDNDEPDLDGGDRVVRSWHKAQYRNGDPKQNFDWKEIEQ